MLTKQTNNHWINHHTQAASRDMNRLNRRIITARLDERVRERESEICCSSVYSIAKLHLNCMLISFSYVCSLVRFELNIYTENRELNTHRKCTFKRGKHLKLWWVNCGGGGGGGDGASYTHSPWIMIGTAMLIWILFCFWFTHGYYDEYFDPPDSQSIHITSCLCLFVCFFFTVNHWLIESFLNASHRSTNQNYFC